MSDRDAFGNVRFDESDPNLDFLSDRGGPAAGDGGGTTEPVAPQQPAPVEPVASQEPPAVGGEETPVATETGEVPAPEATPLIAGRFRTAEEATQGYNELLAHETRVFRESQQKDLRIQQLETALSQAIPIVEAYNGLQQGGQPQGVAPSGEALQFDDPAALQQYIDAKIKAGVNQGIATFQQQMGVQAQQQQQTMVEQAWMQQAQSNLSAFAQKHPEVVPGSAIDLGLEQIMRTHGLDPAKPEHLDLAWDVWTNPLVGRNLLANPGWKDSDPGREMARTWGVTPAAAPNGSATPAAGTAPVQTPGTRPTPTAHVETGAGAPAEPGANPAGSLDLMDDVMAEWDRVKQGRDAFFTR